MTAGARFELDEAVTFHIDCETREAGDYHWERLTEEGEASFRAATSPAWELRRW